MKKVYISILASIMVLSIISYFLSYKYFYSEKDVNNDITTTTEEVVNEVNKTSNNIVTVNTDIVIENYYFNEDKTLYEVVEPFSEIVGLDREGVIEYTKSYLDSPSKQDIEAGLYSYELISFSDNKLVLKKSFKPKPIENKYYVTIKDDYVIIYLVDKQTVYEFTSIDVNTLPEDVFNELSEGMYLKEEYDLYNFLETYSS